MNTMKQQRRRLVMRTTLRTLLAMTLGLLLFLGMPEAARAQYSFTPIDIPDATFTAVNANTTHAIAGEFDDADGVTHGFVLRKGVLTQIDAPDAEGYTSVNGINAKGDLAGIYFANGRYYGYFWRKGKFTTIDVPDANFVVANSVNGRGEVVGFSRKDLEPRHGFLWRKGVLTPIEVPGASSRGPRISGINDHRQIVGAYPDMDNHLHGFLLSKGVYTTLDAPGSEGGFTFAQSLNNRGQIIGYYSTEADAPGSGSDRGFVLDKGVYTLIDLPGALWTAVTSINSKGEIVGAYEDENGVHGFKGTPVRKQQHTN